MRGCFQPASSRWASKIQVCGRLLLFVPDDRAVGAGIDDIASALAPSPGSMMTMPSSRLRDRVAAPTFMQGASSQWLHMTRQIGGVDHGRAAPRTRRRMRIGASPIASAAAAA